VEAPKSCPSTLKAGFFSSAQTGLETALLVSGSPRCVSIFRIGPGSVMTAMSRMAPPPAGHARGNSSPTRAISFAQAIREVSCAWLVTTRPTRTI
jgi:hypothetical protein